MSTSDEIEKDVVVTIDEAAGKTPEELEAERKIDELVAADKAGKEPPKADPAAASAKEPERPLTAQEGQDDLAAQLKAAQETAEAERRERVKAEAAAREAQEAAKRSQGDVMTHRAQVVAAAIETVGIERQQARNAYKAAMEAGDYDAAATAQEQIADSAAKLVRLQEAKAALDAQKGKQPIAHEGRVEKPASQPQDAFEQAVANLSPASQAWARRNPTMFTDQKNFARTLAAHHSAVAEDIAPDTPAYFQFLEERLGLRQKAADPTPPAKGTERSSGARTAAPVARDGNGGGSRFSGGKITLTAAEREAAAISGLTDQEYAMQLLKIERGQSAH